MVGESGRVYALDFHPRAIDKIKKRASRKGLTNIQTIHSSCATGLKDKTIDIALIYDMLHEVTEPNKLLSEIYRVLKPNGILSFSDHHFKEDRILPMLQNKGLFKLAGKAKKTYQFCKQGR